MLAQLFCDIALLSVELAHGVDASLVAASALCLSLACLRCGLWRDGSPGPSGAPELYWTPSMTQVRHVIYKPIVFNCSELCSVGPSFFLVNLGPGHWLHARRPSTGARPLTYGTRARWLVCLATGQPGAGLRI